MYLRLDSYVDTEKGLCFRNSASENMFGNSCAMQSKKYLQQFDNGICNTQTARSKHSDQAYVFV
jgi:hypothetical protein